MKELQNISDKMDEICLALQNVDGLTGAQEGVVQAYVEYSKKCALRRSFSFYG